LIPQYGAAPQAESDASLNPEAATQATAAVVAAAAAGRGRVKLRFINGAALIYQFNLV
jgi:hypothetical protein